MCGGLEGELVVVLMALGEGGCFEHCCLLSSTSAWATD